jgi:glycerol-3-phosphate dehydrogenase
MGEELGWNAARQEKEFDQAIYFLRSMGLPDGHNLKWQEIKKNHGPKTFLGLKPDEAALYSRAQFTPDEVNSLRKQFEQMDFVSSLRSDSGVLVLVWKS